MKTLYIVRGIPGSGKSTFAKSLGIAHVESDMYFIDPITKEYNFDITQIQQAHDWCKSKVESIMMKGNNVVVSNTFTQDWEIESYINLAKKYNYIYHSIIIENRSDTKNIHNVPNEIIKKMRNRFQISL